MTVFNAVQCERGAGNHQVEGVPNNRASVRCEHYQIISQLSHQNFRVCSWTVGTMRGRSNEVVDVISRHKVDICSLQEVRWRGASARLVEGKDSRYKLFWVGNDKGMGSVGILLAEKWVEAIFDVKHVSDRIMLIKLVVGKSIVTVQLVYAPQAGLKGSVL